MSTFSFKSKKIADETVKIVLDKPWRKNTLPANAALTDAWIYKTPVGGIPKREGIDCSFADCTPYYINADDELVELLDDDGASQTQKVYHVFGTREVLGEVYIIAVRVYGRLVVSAEEC